MGNHCTTTEKRLKRLFPKIVRQRILDCLSVDGRRHFTQALHGLRDYTLEELLVWNWIASGRAPLLSGDDPITRGGPIFDVWRR
jgi:hypothetical protein